MGIVGVNWGLSSKFVEAVHTRKPVAGLTHGFYRYPARFSPVFVRAAIEAFTKHGDLVFDPFTGGGTTLVEASASGRRAIGTDINALAVFVARAKTTLLSEKDLVRVRVWACALLPELNLHQPSARAKGWADQGYQRNISGKSTWPIRKLLELATVRLSELHNSRQRRFARCVLLRTAQWALDCRRDIPSAEEFRQKFLANLWDMQEGIRAYGDTVKRHDTPASAPLCLKRSVVGIEHEPAISRYGAPALVLTSPPYPGVHVLYHRWQVRGRRETPAAYWIANGKDGSGTSYYTFGDRHEPDLKMYFIQLEAAFRSVSQIADRRTIVVQMVAFGDASWQLPRYLRVMEDVGFREVLMRGQGSRADGRLWRSVPNRKWYADQKGALSSSEEVVLFHRLA